MTNDPQRDEAQGARLGLALQAAGLGAFDWDLAADIIVVSPLMGRILGLPPGPVAARAGRTLDASLHPDDIKASRAAAAAQLAAEDRYDVEGRLAPRPDGAVRWVRFAGQQVRDAGGTPVSIVGVVEDITRRRQEEERNVTLMAELDHRVKNVLATVQALAAQTAKRSGSLDGFLTTFTGRLRALTSANELLTAARWRGASIDNLAAAELSALAPGQARWEGPELFLTPRAANALALALHELGANALTFGALSVESGRVEVRWTGRPEGGFELVWAESGGPPVLRPSHRGFGATLLGQVTGRELNGEVTADFTPAGVRVRLRAGAAAVVERPDTAPAASAPMREAEVATLSGPVDLRGARVLIVEDAVLLALELETGLLEAGARVVGPAYELEEGMALLSQPIDAAVLDANLNGRSVMPVARALFERGVPFVFATGYGEAGGAPAGFDAPIIRKPYEVTQVAAAVARLLRAA